MTVADLIEVLKDMDPRMRVVIPSDDAEGRRYGLDVLAVYRVKSVNVASDQDDVYRLFRLGTKGRYAIDDEEVVLIDDSFGEGLEHRKQRP